MSIYSLDRRRPVGPPRPSWFIRNATFKVRLNALDPPQTPGEQPADGRQTPPARRTPGTFRCCARLHAWSASATGQTRLFSREREDRSAPGSPRVSPGPPPA